MRRLAGALAALLLSSLPALCAGKLDNVDCVACHPARDPVVFARLSAAGVAQPMNVSATVAVCRTCHNGSVVESRNLLGPRAFGHPTGMAGTKGASGRFPLYGGKLECGSCHTPHPDNSTSLKRPGWLRVSPTDPFPCADCHADEAQAKRGHLGLAVEKKFDEAIRTKGGTLGRKGEIVCVTCHAAHGGAGKALLIAPYGKDGENTLCRLCHPGDESKTPHPVNTGATHHTSENFPLSDSGAVVCSTCHPPHGGSDEKAATGFRGGKDGNALCSPCHPEARANDYTHLGRKLGAKAKADVSLLGGRVGADNAVDCLTCHSAHRGTTGKLLVAPFKNGQATGLCATCHKVRDVTDKIAKGFSQLCTDCHSLHGNPPTPSKPGQDPCLACHPDRMGESEHPLTAKTSPCSACHTMHKGDAKSGWLVNPTEGDAACRGCHDTARYGHATGKPVENADRKLLERRSIRLDGEGRVGCATCHVPHAAKEESLLTQSEEILCLYCHPSQNPYGLEGLKPGAHPVGVELTLNQAKAISFNNPENTGKSEAARAKRFSKLLACSSCHRAHGEKTVGQAKCEGCHEKHDGSASHKNEGGCTACHPVHSEKPPASTCVECHKGKADTSHRSIHRTNPSTLPGIRGGRLVDGGGEIGCPTCHDPHGGEPRLLVRADSSATCAACHPEKAAMKGGPHDLPVGEGVAGGCQSCHPAHGEAVDERSQTARCLDCHDPDIRSAPTHSAEGSLGLWDRTASLPLFDNYGRKNSYGFVDCPTCHDVHQPAGKRGMRLSTGQVPSLCLSCHPEKQSLLGTPHDASANADSPGDAPCELCHSVHALGKMPPAWKLEAGAQGTLNDRKCSPCHGPPEGGPKAHGGPGSHPVDITIPATMSAKGLKLFSTTGGPIGRTLTCSTCHNIHGEISNSGERRENFLRRPVEDAALCLVCHEETKSVAATAHDLPAADKPLGPCSPCHEVHGANPVGALWGLTPFPEGLPQNRMCKSCHSRASGKPGDSTRLYHHMKDAEPAFNSRGTIYLQRPMIMSDEQAERRGEGQGILLYDAKGEVTGEGNLTCSSCHNPHQWSPESPTIKPNPNAKWSATTKFLKFRSASEVTGSLCGDCHKENPGSYYRRYHEVWSDVDLKRK